jgi:hypothetical protein
MLSFLNWNNEYNVWWSIISIVLFVVAIFGVIIWAVTHIGGRDELTRSSTPNTHPH